MNVDPAGDGRMARGASLLETGPSDRRVAAAGVLGPALVSVAYYLGAQIGFALQSPDAPQSVLWLPNSILLAVLLLVPFATWPVYLIAAFPAQMLVAWQTNAPAVTMALLFLTNCADAALGAFLVRRIAQRDGPFHFDSFWRALVFAVFGATLAPVTLSFADAAISVATGWASSFDAALLTRIRSNTLTHLIAVPALMGLFAVKVRQVRVARVLEIAVVFVLLAIAATFMFARPAGRDSLPALVYAPLPLLFFAAVRFGPAGTGWSVLLVAVVASWNALHGRGPFNSPLSSADVISLQAFLLAISVPLLFLSVAIQERNHTMASLRGNEAALRRSYARARELAQKLIAAQEIERTRIARDMHDDINQQLAALSISISSLRSRVVGEPELQNALNSLQERTIALSEQVRQLSHDLHPGTLEHMGLVPALRGHCTEFGQRHRLHLEFIADRSLGPVPKDVSICLFRIVQEGLRNVVNHAESSTATVWLSRSDDDLELTIADSGRGFDPESQTQGGLGLLSISERARLVGGTLSIRSSPGRGTMLQVQIPMARLASPMAVAERA
jgi:two-component system, NarL family, sensor histidine kinase UhpB